MESLFFQTTRNGVGKALVQVCFSDAGSGRDGQQERLGGFTTVSAVRGQTKLWLALLFPVAKIGVVFVRFVRLVGSVCRKDQKDNVSTDFGDVHAVFAFEACADAKGAADRPEEIQTEDRWWNVRWLSLQMERSKRKSVDSKTFSAQHVWSPVPS